MRLYIFAHNRMLYSSAAVRLVMCTLVYKSTHKGSTILSCPGPPDPGGLFRQERTKFFKRGKYVEASEPEVGPAHAQHSAGARETDIQTDAEEILTCVDLFVLPQP